MFYVRYAKNPVKNELFYSCSIVVLWLFYSCSIVVLWLFYSCPGSCTMATALRTCASGVDDDVHMRWWLHTLVWDKQTRKKERSVRRSCVQWWCLNQMVFLQRGDFLTRQSSKPERNPTTSTYYAECSPRHIWREGLDNVAIAGADLRCDFLMCVVLSLSLSFSPPSLPPRISMLDHPSHWDMQVSADARAHILQHCDWGVGVAPHHNCSVWLSGQKFVPR